MVIFLTDLNNKQTEVVSWEILTFTEECTFYSLVFFLVYAGWRERTGALAPSRARPFFFSRVLLRHVRRTKRKEGRGCSPSKTSQTLSSYYSSLADLSVYNANIFGVERMAQRNRSFHLSRTSLMEKVCLISPGITNQSNIVGINRFLGDLVWQSSKIERVKFDSFYKDDYSNLLDFADFVLLRTQIWSRRSNQVKYILSWNSSVC